MWSKHTPLIQYVNRCIEPRVANSVDRAHVFGNYVCDGIRYFFMPVRAGWICGGIVKCVLNLGMCGGGRSRGAFHFWVLFKWLNKLVVFPWGVDTVTWHILYNIFVCSESDSLKSKFFHTTEFALPFFPTKGCTSAIFYQLLLRVFSKHTLATCTGNTHRRGWKRTFSSGGGVECTGGDGRVPCIYHTRHGVWQNDPFITIILLSWLREAKIEIEIEIQLIAQP